MGVRHVSVLVEYPEDRTVFTCDNPECATEFTNPKHSDWLPIDWYSIGNTNGAIYAFCSHACLLQWATTQIAAAKS